MTKTQTELKRETMAYFETMTPAERLSRACWNEPYFNIKPTDKYGNLFGNASRIWIDRAGNIYANKPKK